MANIVIANNGNDAKATVLDEEGNVIQEAILADPKIKVTNDATGQEYLLSPGTSMGLAHGKYIVEVV